MKTVAGAVKGWDEACARGERFLAGTETAEDRAEFNEWLGQRSLEEAYREVLARSEGHLASN